MSDTVLIFRLARLLLRLTLHLLPPAKSQPPTLILELPLEDSGEDKKIKQKYAEI